MRIAQGFAVISSTLMLVLWTNLIARQQEPLVLVGTQLILLLLVICGLRRQLHKMGLVSKLLTGAGAGLLAACGSMAIVAVLLYGGDQFIDRYFNRYFYVYPLLSFAWLHGAILASVWFKRADMLQPQKAHPRA